MSGRALASMSPPCPAVPTDIESAHPRRTCRRDVRVLQSAPVSSALPGSFAVTAPLPAPACPDPAADEAAPSSWAPGELALARHDFLAGDLTAAAARVKRVLAGLPTNPAALRQLGLIRLVEGKAAEARALLLPLADRFPDDPDLTVALAEAVWVTESAAAAIPHFERALTLAPERVAFRLRLGLALLTAGDAAAARRQLEQVAAAQPDSATALTYLGMAMLATGVSVRALCVLQRARSLDGTNAAAAFQLGQALRELGRTDEALPVLRDAVALAPTQAHLRVGLGDALLAAGRPDEAAPELRAAATLDPGMGLAWSKLGETEQLLGESAAAAVSFGRAVALAPEDPTLRAMLGNALFVAGDSAGAAAELGHGMALNWRRPAPRGEALRVGILAAPGLVNTPTDYLIDRQRHIVAPLFLLPGFRYPCNRIAAAHDVLFNAISDADAAPAELAQAAALAPALGLPVLNPPAAIPHTTRQAMAMRLAGIPGLRVPPTRRVRRDALPEFAGPVLVRSVGSHGGHGLQLADSAAERAAAVAAAGTPEVYLTDFVDFRAADGCYRKLRLVFVGGEMFPVHLIIGQHWLLHYFRSSMATTPAWRDEEAAFLRRPDLYLGPRVGAALTALAARIELDFFGIDAAIDRDGDLLLFECNATMLVRDSERPAMFHYKRAPVRRIREAMTALLRRRADAAITRAG